MLVITRGLSLNGWIKIENTQLKVFELGFTANVVRKKNFSRRKNEGKDRESAISKLYKLNLTTCTFIFNDIGHFQSDKMSMKQIQGNCFFWFEEV